MLGLSTTNTEIGQCVKMTELYDSLELAKINYSRFVRTELLKNPSLFFNSDENIYLEMQGSDRGLYSILTVLFIEQ